MINESQIEIETTALTPFHVAYESTSGIEVFSDAGEGNEVGVTEDAARAFDPGLWELTKPMLRPRVWAWYDAHRDMKIAKIGGIFQIRLHSFGIAEMVITAIIGARNS